MNEKYNVYLVSDSTGETLDRIFLSLKSQFSNFEYNKKEFAFVRTEQQIDKIIKECDQIDNAIILYTIVETKLAKYLANQSEKFSVPCFGVLGNLILSFSKLLNQKAIHKPSAQHVLDEDYYKRIEAIQFTMTHDDGKKVDDINNADIILLGVSRTSKTPTSIYLANRGYKTVNIPLVLDQKIPENLTIDLEGVDIGESFKISSIKLDSEVVPTIQGRDFVIATLAAPTVMKEPEKPAESEATEGEEGAEGVEAAADGEKPAAEGDKKEADDKKPTDKKSPEEKK